MTVLLEEESREIRISRRVENVHVPTVVLEVHDSGLQRMLQAFFLRDEIRNCGALGYVTG